MTVNDTRGEQAKSVYSDVRSETADQHSGRLENTFDRERVRKELDVQREVSQNFSRNVGQAKAEINKHLDDLKAQLETGRISREEYDRQTANWQYGQVALNAVSAGLAAPTDSGLGIAAVTAGPAAAYAVGQYFKGLSESGKSDAGQKAAHIIAHAVLGAATAAAGGNDAGIAALAAGGSEAAAPVLSKWLYGEKDGGKLTAEQKQTVSSILSLASAGLASGSGPASAVQTGNAAATAVENNFLVSTQSEALKTSGCKTVEECQALRQAYDKGTIASAKNIGAPVVDMLISELFPAYDLGKSYYQAETPADKMLAFIAVIPFEKLGSSAKEAYTQAKDLLKSGKTSEAYGYFAQMSQDLAHSNVSLAVAGNGVKVKVPKGEIPQQAMAAKSSKNSDSSISSNQTRKISQPVFKTDIEAEKIANELGYSKTNFRTKSGTVIFRKGKALLLEILMAILEVLGKKHQAQRNLIQKIQEMELLTSI